MGERAGSGETSLGDLCVRLLVWMGSAIGGEWFWGCTCRLVPPARHRGHASGKVSPMEQFLLGADQLRGRGGGKWTKYPADVIPAFVADMDFKVAPAVQTAITQFTDTQDYGYGTMTDAIPLFDAFAAWMARRHRWQPDPTLTHANTDVIQGLVAMLVAFTAPGDGIIVQTPIYPPFLRFVASTGRRLVENPLVDDGTRFVMDPEGLERVAPQATMILLCNPHNPTGRVLERAELEGIAAIAAAHNLMIVLDEIHADLVYPGATHIPMETIEAAVERTVTLTSATKGFNIAGLRTSIAHFGSAGLKEKFDNAKVALSDGTEFGEPGHGHVRLNFATSEEILEEILGRLGGALTPR